MVNKIIIIIVKDSASPVMCVPHTVKPRFKVSFGRSEFEHN
jgi:hypothetical protein